MTSTHAFPFHPFEDYAASCSPSVRQPTIVGVDQLPGPFSLLTHYTMQNRSCMAAGALFKKLLVWNQFSPITYDMGDIWEQSRRELAQSLPTGTHWSHLATT